MASNSPRPRVMIIGAGFGGLWAAKSLRRADVEVLILDRNNYHTFLPLLYQVAAAEVSPEDIIYPIRSILRNHPNVNFVMNKVVSIDLDGRQVKTQDYNFSYDYLILAIGSTAHFFGVPGAAEFAFELKTLDQAIALRNHILLRFERALCEDDTNRRRQMLTFAIVGGGPTGVEYAGALSELVRGALARDYPALDLHEVRILLVEAADRLLSGLPERLHAYAMQRLQRMGVEVRLNAPASRIDPQAITLADGTPIPTETVIWTAGVSGMPIAHQGELPLARNSQVQVLPTLQVAGYPEVYVAGDLARVEENGHPLPMVAPVATQQGTLAAQNIMRQIEGRELLHFHYKDAGTLATIGRNSAVALLHGRTFIGFPAWLLWLGVHLVNLIGFRNRLIVLINWAWDYLFFERAVRLIMPSILER